MRSSPPPVGPRGPPQDRLRLFYDWAVEELSRTVRIAVVWGASGRPGAGDGPKSDTGSVNERLRSHTGGAASDRPGGVQGASGVRRGASSDRRETVSGAVEGLSRSRRGTVSGTVFETVLGPSSRPSSKPSPGPSPGLPRDRLRVSGTVSGQKTVSAPGCICIGPRL